ncbi:hypothetical protein F5051DRAFT_296177, partial [Lentinula edodes]
GPNLQQQKTLIDIPEDIGELEKRFNLDVDTTLYAVYDKPIKTFEFYSFLDWFGRFIALPRISGYGDTFCEQISGSEPPLSKQETADGRFYYELRGHDGKLFVRERG